MSAETRPAPRATGRSTAVVWIALMLLAGASFALSYVNLGAASVPVALAIAAVKAMLVLLFFMELIDQRFTNRATMIVAVVFVVLLGGLMVADVLTRDPPPLQPPVHYGYGRLPAIEADPMGVSDPVAWAHLARHPITA